MDHFHKQWFLNVSNLILSALRREFAPQKNSPQRGDNASIVFRTNPIRNFG